MKCLLHSCPCIPRLHPDYFPLPGSLSIIHNHQAIGRRLQLLPHFCLWDPIAQLLLTGWPQLWEFFSNIQHLMATGPLHQLLLLLAAVVGFLSSHKDQDCLPCSRPYDLAYVQVQALSQWLSSGKSPLFLLSIDLEHIGMHMTTLPSRTRHCICGSWYKIKVCGSFAQNYRALHSVAEH